MSERGVFAIDRGAWEHDFLADDQPFSRREAWFWLVSEAAWKPHRRRITGKVIELARGQYAGSFRFIASKWRWSEARVRRFVSGLISEGMVDAKSDAGVTVITICNYDKYQRVSLPSDAMSKVDVDAGATQERRKVEDKEYKEKNAPALPTPSVDPEVELFRRGRDVLGKQAGGVIANLLKAKQGNVALARAAIEQASTKSNAREYIGRIISGAQQAAQPNWLDGIEGVL